MHSFPMCNWMGCVCGEQRPGAAGQSGALGMS